MTAARPRVAFVVQRYGADVTGGSESLAREVAERLSPELDVTVFTTCARDYVTWRNEYAPGPERVGPVTVRRFPVVEERDLAAFNAFAEPLYERPHGEEEELEFLRRQGPHTPALVEALGREKDAFAAVVFFTYLYYPTFFGLRAAPERALLVPTTHDEPPLRFGVYREVFARARAFAFLTPAEETLVRARFALGDRPAAVAGMGIEIPPAPDAEGFRIRHGLHRPYAIYAGRIDSGKGCAEMLAFHERYRHRTGGGADLVLIGRLHMELPPAPGLRYLGFLDEAEKQAALAAARAVVCPSPYESLSIALLEGLAVGTPALVTAKSAVLVEHCRRAQAGLYYADADEFAEALALLVEERPLHEALAANGRRYVAEHYGWPAVLARWRGLVEAAGRGA